jgi:TonB family protein
MKFLSQLLTICVFGCGTVFAQSSIAAANSSSCQKPDYPAASKRLEEEGIVNLKFLVGADGKVLESKVEKSSGFRRLDEAAIKGLSKCVFQPAIKDGVPVESYASMKFKWELEPWAPCVGEEVSKWNSCLGSLTSSSGGLIVVEFSKGIPEGRGIEYDNKGKLLQSGEFSKGKLVKSRLLTQTLYPFNANLVSLMPSGPLLPAPTYDLQSTLPTSYAQLIRMRIKPNITFTEEVAGNPKAVVEVRLAPDGVILSRKLLSTSGIRSWDDAVLKAIDKTKVIQKDNDGKVPSVLEISFKPYD